MVFKRFRVNIIIRVVFLNATLFFFFYLLFITHLYATSFIVGAAGAYQIFSLINYIEKTNRDINRFLLAIRHSDFSQSFSASGLGSTFDNLKQAFSEVIDVFRRERAEKEEHYRYLQTIIQHIGIGLIAFTQDGTIELINNAAKKMFKTPYIKNINTLRSVSEELAQKLFSLRAGEQTLVKVILDNDLLQLAIYGTEFKLREQQYTLVSIQNIQNELEEKEMEAWQKLIRVLTHEIMNSITPISSLASTVNNIISSAAGNADAGLPQQLSEESTADISDALQTIHKRSRGLLHFVGAYRNLTLIPKPHFEIFPVKELFNRIEKLMKTQTGEKHIELRTNVDPVTLEVTADTELIEQVLINLIQNAIHALNGTNDPCIEIRGFLGERGHVVIQVEDNGPGIPGDVIDQIFVPFFTTKKGGSGIGLSLSRQIMRLHKGTITVTSTSDQGTTFTLIF